MYNKVLLIGNLTRDPEMKYLPSGTPLASFDVAVNEKYRDRNNELKEEVSFIHIEAFQRLAETCGQYLRKGRRVFVEGKLRQDTWEAQDGGKRSRILVRAQIVQFLDAKGAGDSDSQSGPPPQQRPAQQPPRQTAPQQQPSAQPQGGPGQAQEPQQNYGPAQDLPERDINEPGFDEGNTEDDLPF